ncbi:peptidase inhibitor clitocypin-domain-containing protein [Infundibulicybe gibba]|nr:peptidase inhibitor clitocypin-domain-containing protein [Infundibulicybe gibba]
MSDPKPLPTNLYTIRPTSYDHPKPIPIGGMFVTGKGFGQPPILYAQRPPQFERQNWHVFHNKKMNQYTIKFVELDGSERYGFSWERNIGPETPVILGKPHEFTISPIESNEHACIIRPVTNTIGVDICVGFNPGTRELEFQTFPIESPINRRPVWWFEALPVE